MVDRVLAHIRKQGYFVVDHDPDTATLAAHLRIAKVTTRAGATSGAWRTDPDDPQAQFVTDALLSGTSERLIRIRTLGGGVPATAFIDAYHVPTVGLSLANYDDNQHTDNENLRLGQLVAWHSHAGRNHDEVGRYPRSSQLGSRSRPDLVVSHYSAHQLGGPNFGTVRSTLSPWST